MARDLKEFGLERGLDTIYNQAVDLEAVLLAQLSFGGQKQTSITDFINLDAANNTQ